MEKRARCFFIQRNMYFETHDKDGKEISNETVTAWKKRVYSDIAKLDGVKWFAMIFHDHDLLDDGTPKGIHVHVLIMFENAKTQTAVMKLTGTSSVQNTQVVRDKVNAARYLTHISEDAINKNKYRYSDDDVICENCKYSDMIIAKRHKKVDSLGFVNELSAKLQHYELNLREAKKSLMNEFGDDGMTVWRTYRGDLKKDFAEGLSYQSRKYRHENRDLKTFYISGPGGVGKSQLAKAMALVLASDYHSAAVGGKDKTFDFVSGYEGEKVSILNEVEPSAFNKREFFNAFDPYQFSMVNSRNADKAWLAEFAFITYTSRLADWIHGLLCYTKGSTKLYGQKIVDSDFRTAFRDVPNYDTDYWQALRRFRYEIVVEGVAGKNHESTATVYRVDSKTHTLKLWSQRTCSNVTSDELCRDWATELLYDFQLKTVTLIDYEAKKLDDSREKFADSNYQPAWGTCEEKETRRQKATTKKSRDLFGAD
ncbi:Rep family protein [Levilactobacillus brevis]|uniref:Rep family protein n=3 Tax=Levilactobacillus brevis TaxID=1580 RepID=UPI003EBD3FD3